MRELVIRRGREFFEWREREENDSKFRTSGIPTYPVCQKPSPCKWCQGMQIASVFVTFPVRIAKAGREAGVARHVVTPAAGCHLVAMEFCEAHPNQPIRAGWVLTDEEKLAGKKGTPWPSDV